MKKTNIKQVNQAGKSNIVNYGEQFKKNRCPDIVAGINGCFWFDDVIRLVNRKRLKVEAEYEGITIVIILESPHVNEFKHTSPTHPFFQEGIEANPAMGRTGKVLQIFLTDDNLKKLLGDYYPEDGNYRVILMNSIQYQCSLGKDTKQYRDKVWLEQWFNKEMSVDFMNRLNSYNPNIILNCCTLGRHYKGGSSKEEKITVEFYNNIVKKEFQLPKDKKDLSIRKFVTEKILNENRMALLYEFNHPSSWSVNRNRKIKRYWNVNMDKLSFEFE